MPGTRSRETALVAALSRSRTPDDPVLLDARRRLNLRRAEDQLDRFLAAVPPPTVDDVHRLTARLSLAVIGGPAT